MIEKEFSNYSDIKEFCKNLPCCPFYRATKTSYLLPKLITSKFTNYKEYVEKEEEMNSIFCWQYADLINETDFQQRNWEFRIIAREHGLFNRLMDWSNDFITALDFATSKQNEITEPFIYLWVLNYDNIIDRGSLRKIEFLKIKTSVLIHGTIHAPGARRLDQHRQSIQGGFFLVQPSQLITEQINMQSFFQDKLIRIKIPSTEISTIRKEMIQTENGINFSQSIMFSENDCIDEFCNNLNKEHLF